ncbi:alpha/beta hydrolase [soil metagenome]
MEKFRSDNVEIAYEVTGEGDPVLLIHGFASNVRVNWIDTGWVKTLSEAGYRAIVMDNRGHGESTKLYAPGDYGADVMAMDAKRLLDHLKINQAFVMGYSMGARITTFLSRDYPALVRGAVLGGLAGNLISGVLGSEQIARGLEAASLDDVTDSQARAFRIFAEQTGSDRRALAACIRAPRQTLTTAELGDIVVPTLVVAGDADDIAGPIDGLVNAIPGARGVSLPRRNHMNAVGDRQYKEAVLEFFQSVKEADG